jgi:phospholipid/cholesterol/gamma-HCH transport system substrate-binding protein
MKRFSERNPIIIGAVSIAVIAALVLFGLTYDKLPFLGGERTYSAYFADAAALRTGADVEVSGSKVGKVTAVSLDGSKARVEFTVSRDISLGDRTEAAIKTETLLGTKVVAITPRGTGALAATIPLERTTSPYLLPAALGDLTKTISGLNTNELSDSLKTLSEVFQNTPPELRAAVDGVSRLSQTINNRDEQLRNLLSSAHTATGVLRQRTDQIVGLVRNGNALLTELRAQSGALDQISTNISAMARALSTVIDDNRTQLPPMLDKLNTVLAVIEKHKQDLQRSIKLNIAYALSLGESVSSGPFFNAYLVNLLPGQFIQPFVDAAFSDLGLDPNTLLPSQLVDPQTGQQATPALPVPFPRTGQGGEPHLNLPDAITGKPGDPRYPYREPLPAPPPGGPPPGPPAQPAPSVGGATDPTGPQPVFQPAPNEVPATPQATASAPSPQQPASEEGR